MSNPLALIVDDEPDIRELLELTINRMGIDTKAAVNLTEARNLLQQHNFDLCLTDMRLPDGNGIDLVRDVGNNYPQLPIAVITAHGNMDSAIESLKAGAFDFVSKPVDLKLLRTLVETALRVNKAEKPTPNKESEKSSESTTAAKLLGKSTAVETIRKMTIKLARNQAPVYISGESGTGKELAARLIHEQGPRSDKAFVAVNCGAIPQELMESEFFGHKKGSFTGAISDKEGLFKTADGGTLFLDEVADLPMPMQVKLLRAIQEKSIRPVGEQYEIPVDVRIISASNQDLAQMVEEQEFRQDLFYRINVIKLHIPPLRERKEDIPVLVNSILSKLAEANNVAKPRIERDALEKMYNYPFPGNIRQLENTIEHAMALCDEGSIGLDDLNLPEPTTAISEIGENQSLEEYLEQVERQLITKALEETHWNKTAAAKKLGLSFRALRYRLSKLGID
jgi:two-component system, NtrC family, response regulator PilR